MSILMDLHMPGLNGIEATGEIVSSSPHIGVLVLTMMEDEESVFAAMRAGARGYLLKGARRRGDRPLDRGGRRWGGHLRAGHRRAHDDVLPGCPARRPPRTTFPELTERERMILGTHRRGPRERARSRASWACRSRRCATTRATSSPSCRSRIVRRRSCWPGRPVWSESLAVRRSPVEAGIVAGVLPQAPSLRLVGEDDAGPFRRRWPGRRLSTHVVDLAGSDQGHGLGEAVELGGRQVGVAWPRSAARAPVSMKPSVVLLGAHRPEDAQHHDAAGWPSARSHRASSSRRLRENARASSGVEAVGPATHRQVELVGHRRRSATEPRPTDRRPSCRRNPSKPATKT